ncbi:MAG: DUF736 domain-containing protein [Sphingobium sp.]|nr:DUF736 domain-containing protein [Sphingobium sp.]
MAMIGKFTAARGGFEGTIETFLTVLEVRIEPADPGPEAAPDFRIHRGAAEIGAAWERQTKAKRRYLAVVIDDPSLARPIECRLVQAESHWKLMWSRN